MLPIATQHPGTPSPHSYYLSQCLNDHSSRNIPGFFLLLQSDLLLLYNCVAVSQTSISCQISGLTPPQIDSQTGCTESSCCSAAPVTATMCVCVCFSREEADL